MAITWMRTSDAFPHLDRSDKDFTAFDGDEIVGRVYQFEAGLCAAVSRLTREAFFPQS